MGMITQRDEWEEDGFSWCEFMSSCIGRENCKWRIKNHLRLIILEGRGKQAIQ